MDQIQVKRDRLLRQTARAYGAAGLLAALVVLSTPEVAGRPAYWIVLPLFAVAGICVGMLQSRRTLWWVAGLVASVIAIAVVLGAFSSTQTSAAGLAVATLLGGSLPGALLVMLAYRLGPLWFWIGVVIAAVTAGLAVDPSVRNVGILIVLLGGGLAHGIGYLLASSIPPALRQIAEVGRAHRAERHASELEAQRRQSARLLHDTVLATLTLLAHSGRGVSEEALREQARNDAHLLRLLRLGEPLFNLPQAGYRPEPVEETTLGTTLDSVKQRFDQLGLDVAWHGTGRVLLPPGVLDGFLFAISECLENVRRHSGVSLAHVTITEDEKVVRAMITDAGKGFQLEEVGSERLGIKESVIARLAEVGGSARLFSSPGAGTTVLLEVPR
ncbi:MAG: histidine kinase [Microbacteriaceae bacterium]|nr:histidine kinase [Microbacteriaceae bacterium]